MGDPTKFLQENKSFIKKILQDEVVYGGTILSDLKKKIPQSEAENVVKLLIGEGCLNHITSSTNIWDDEFEVDYEKLERTLSKGLELPNSKNLKLRTQEPEAKEIEQEEGKLEESKPLEEGFPVGVANLTPIISSRDEGKNRVSITDAFRFLIDKAENEIKIISPFIDRHGVAYFHDHFLNALEEGVEIKIICRPGGGDNSRGLRYFADILQRKSENILGGVEVRSFHFTEEENQMYSVHSKMIVVDSQFSYVGSGEFRGNSLWRLIEFGLIVGEDFSRDFDNLFDLVWEESNQVWRIPE